MVFSAISAVSAVRPYFLYTLCLRDATNSVKTGLTRRARRMKLSAGQQTPILCQGGTA
jgi:hypothetical protein